MGCTHSHQPRNDSNTVNTTPLRPTPRQQKLFLKEEARRAEVERQERILGGGMTVGSAWNPQYGRRDGQGTGKGGVI